MCLFFSFSLLLLCLSVSLCLSLSSRSRSRSVCLCLCLSVSVSLSVSQGPIVAGRLCRCVSSTSWCMPRGVWATLACLSATCPSSCRPCWTSCLTKVSRRHPLASWAFQKSLNPPVIPHKGGRDTACNVELVLYIKLVSSYSLNSVDFTFNPGPFSRPALHLVHCYALHLTAGEA